MTVFAQPSPSPDTSIIWINRQDALRKLAQSDSAKVFKVYVDSLKRDILHLNGRIENLDRQIANLKLIDQNSASQITELEAQKETLNNQKKELLDIIAEKEKSLTRQKRKTFWTAMGGVAAAVTAFFLGSGL